MVARSMNSRIEAAFSKVTTSTSRAYRKDWQYFTDWCSEHCVQSLPAEPDTVRRYVLSLKSSTQLSAATVLRRIAAVGFVHHACQFDSPINDPGVKEVTRQLRDENKSKSAQGIAGRRKKPALTRDVRRMVTELPPSRIGWRDRAIILLMFSGGMRPSELVSLHVDDLAFEPDRARMWLQYPSSAADDDEGARVIEIPRSSDLEFCPVHAIEQWLSVSKITDGPLFRGLGARAELSDQPVSEAMFTTIVKRAACLAGFNPAHFSAESLRIGLLVSAHSGGASIRRIAEHAGYKHPESVRRQIRRHTRLDDNPARKAEYSS